MKSQPGGVQYVSPAIGAVGNLVAEYVAEKENVKLVHVAYRGGGAAIQDLVAGHVKVGSMTLSTTRPHILAGKLPRSRSRRRSALAGISRSADAGRARLSRACGHHLVFALGSGRPAAARSSQKLNAAVNKAMDVPEVKKHLETGMVQTKAMTPEEITRSCSTKSNKWAPAPGASPSRSDRQHDRHAATSEPASPMTTCASGSSQPSCSARSGQVKGASWQEDIGLAAEAMLRAEDGPCVVFDEVPGCPKGFRVLINMFAGIRRNMTLGFPDHLTKWELSDAFREAYLKDSKPIPHEIVENGPMFENIIIGDEIDVPKFPSPIWHEQDGGRYIGTGTYSITRDPEENWLNAGAYRAMVHDRNSVGMLMAAGHHGAIHCEKYFKRGEPMPVATRPRRRSRSR